MSERQVAYILDPRFPGGTSAAVAQELRAISQITRPKIYAISSRMFKGKMIAPALKSAFDDLDLTPIWDPSVISADIVILHNPSFLKFQTTLGFQVFSRQLFVVTHENFLLPQGGQAFGIEKCLALIARQSLAEQKIIAPISPINRRGVVRYLTQTKPTSGWEISQKNWFNICDFDLIAPNHNPSDHRGRHSRPGYEKFPNLATMDICFPPNAGANIILGGDTYRRENINRPHWDLIPFGGEKVDQFLKKIDFMIYFTADNWRESFGRVLAEAIAAGKIVISDHDTAANFGPAAIGTVPDDIGRIVEHFIKHPAKYRQHVVQAQSCLDRFSVENFEDFFLENVFC